MAKRLIIGLSILIFLLLVIWLLRYLAVFEFLLPESQRTAILSQFPLSSITNDSDASASADANRELVHVKLEVVAQNLTVPWAIAFTDASRILVTERTGSIREIKDGTLNPKPLFTFKEVAGGGEIGLMGLVLDPDYNSNLMLYVCVGYSRDGKLYDKVVALHDDSTVLTETRTVFDNIPAGANHAGCELAFGPDKKLYITAGDATTKAIAQDLGSLGGKILRINPDSSIPSDNPFPNSAIYSYGHRNPQGIDWDVNRNMYETEHGPSGNDGPGGGDELNFIEKGANYGWPLVSHNETRAGTVAPLIVYTPAVAPSSLLVYKGNMIPEFNGNIFFSLLKGEGIMRVIVAKNEPKQIISYEKLPELKVGRIRDIYQGKDGYIYFTTSNKDGRGTPKSGDDKLYRLAPEFK